ncbi:MAG: proton-conducting membrane transporter [Lachnospiraceae bacterium]|nr:proton-conducting membrane transporter [Lachnospiraceae bacterium]
MHESMILMLPILVPVMTGLLLLCMPAVKNRKVLIGITAAGLIVTAALVFFVLFQEADSFTFFYLTKSLPVYFKIDGIGRIFVTVVTIVWLSGGAFAFEYMKHETDEKRYFGFYLIVYGILVALDFSGNIITFYLFYEMMTLLSMPLVLHTRSREAVMAGLKYMLYSFCGAYMVLYGVYFLFRFSNTLTFTAGGVLNQELIAGREQFLLFVVFLMILGFGVKAGMFPMHGWLPTAHPVAPAPASAVLSGIIVKSGVLGVIRTVYYLFGADFIRGTWVQTTWIWLTLFTVFMGSMLAYREKLLKKRLAYSTVSQVSYILFGLSMLDQTAMTGSLLHVICHAFIKCTLFLCAGAIIYKTGKTRVDELAGIGKEMPALLWCYTIVSLALIGIPPTGGFVSKWYLATGALRTKLPIVSWFGPLVLLVSALLTAGYLLPVTIQGFFPGKAFDYTHLKKKEPNLTMLLPVIVLTVLAVLVGMFPSVVTDYIVNHISGLF